MIKSELIMRLVEKANLSKLDAQKAVDTIFDEIILALSEGGRVELRNFGILSVRTRKSRIGRNPKTGEKVQVQSKRVPYFKAGKAVKKALNKKNA
ncbi:MAG: integration host factor subunit beta [Alphaproteobacteria bacterium]|nr:integration host factor subunit beta [Alphaproteobacteria bacterium]